MTATGPYGGWKGNPKHRIFFNNFDIRETATCEIYIDSDVDKKGWHYQFIPPGPSQEQINNAPKDRWEFHSEQMNVARRAASSGVVKILKEDAENGVSFLQEYFYVIGGEQSCPGCIWPGKSKSLLSSVEIMSVKNEEYKWDFGPSLPGMFHSLFFERNEKHSEISKRTDLLRKLNRHRRYYLSIWRLSFERRKRAGKIRQSLATETWNL